MNRIIGTMLLVGILLLSGCGTSALTATPEPLATPLPPTATPIPTLAPDSIALKLAEATNARNLEGALALFAEDAVVNSGGPEPFVGKAEVRGWLEGMIADNFQIEIEILEVSGDKVVEKDTMTMDSVSALGISSLEGISEITVQEGKITALDFTFAEASLAALQSATMPAITLEDLVGTWRWDGGEVIGPVDLCIHKDGAYEFIRYIVDSEILWDAGTIEIDGNLVTYVSSEDSRYCVVGQRGSYELSFAEDGQLKSELVEDECWRRKPPAEGPVFLEPLAELQSATTPAITIEDLVGTWSWDGGEVIGLVEFRYYKDSTYEMIRYIMDSETLWDVGTIEIDGNLVTYVSSEDTRYCAVGQHGSYEMSLGEDGQLKVELVEDGCSRRKPPVEEPVFLSRNLP